MKQQDANKIIAVVLGLTMVFSIFAYIFINPQSDTSQETDEGSQQEKYNPEFWTVSQPFNSITDALNMTPPGAESASYADLESMTPQMIQWVRQDFQLIGELDSIYNSNTTRVYYANLREGKNNSFLLLNTMSPEKNDFEYMVSPYAYGRYDLLIRQEQGLSGLYNVMGTPVILAPPQTVIEVLDIITSLNKTNTSYDRYEGLLRKVGPAPFQTLSSNVSFAAQYYMGVRLNNGSYERTTAYMNVNASTLKKLNQLKANSTQRGFSEYDITRSGAFTIVKIATGEPDLLRVLSEETS